MSFAQKRANDAVAPPPLTRGEVLARRIEEAVRKFVLTEAVYSAPFALGGEPIHWGADWYEEYGRLFGFTGEVDIARLLAICAAQHDARSFGGYELQVLAYAMHHQRMGTLDRAAMLHRAEEEYVRVQPDARFVRAEWWRVYKNLVLLGWEFVRIDASSHAALGAPDELKTTIVRRWREAHASSMFSSDPLQ